MSSQVRERVSQVEVRRSRAARLPFGLSAGEIVSAGLVTILFLVVIFYYFTSLGPEKQRLEQLERQDAAQRAEIVGGASGSGTVSKGDTLKEALDSLESFKAARLKPNTQGEIALYKEINALAAKQGVKLASGIEMRREAVKEETDQKALKDNPKAALAIFPQTLIRFTVGGQYQNLRNFINELEHTKQFVIINAINLINVEEQEGGRGSRGVQVSGIALSIEMTAYFQP
jgi:hypothetical protein